MCNTGEKLGLLRAIHLIKQKQIAAVLKIQQSYYSKIELYNPSKHSRYIIALAEFYHLEPIFLYDECELDYYLENPPLFAIAYQKLRKQKC